MDGRYRAAARPGYFRSDEEDEDEDEEPASVLVVAGVVEPDPPSELDVAVLEVAGFVLDELARESVE